jgi:hypothetical protein
MPHARILLQIGCYRANSNADQLLANIPRRNHTQESAFCRAPDSDKTEQHYQTIPIRQEKIRNSEVSDQNFGYLWWNTGLTLLNIT